jgi:hypothetical protein
VQWRTSFHVGIFLGIVTMLTQFELTLFALFASYSHKSKLDGDGLVASFSFFLFLLYGAFTFVLMKNRGLVVEGRPPAHTTSLSPILPGGRFQVDST